MAKRKIRVGIVGQRILLLLLGGLTLGLSRTTRGYFRLTRVIRKEWKEIGNEELYYAIRTLYSSKLVDARENKDGTLTLELTEGGKSRALTYDPDKMKLSIPKKWDGHWRMVLFDVPETRKQARDAFSFHMKRLGFFAYQKSVFVHPSDCQDEIEFLVEHYEVRPYVRFLIVSSIDNELHLKKYFGLLRSDLK